MGKRIIGRILDIDQPNCEADRRRIKRLVLETPTRQVTLENIEVHPWVRRRLSMGASGAFYFSMSLAHIYGVRLSDGNSEFQIDAANFWWLLGGGLAVAVGVSVGAVNPLGWLFALCGVSAVIVSLDARHAQAMFRADASAAFEEAAAATADAQMRAHAKGVLEEASAAKVARVVTVRSIDGGAAGFVRHRFMRAFSASMLVFIVATILVSAGAALVFQVSSSSGALDYASNGAAIVLMFVVLVAAACLSAALLGAVLDFIHRRWIAAVMLIVSALLAFYHAEYAAVAFENVFDVTLLKTAATREIAQKLPAGGQLAAASLVAYAMTVLIMLECAGWAWWQLRASRADFAAVRGWRPSPWRLFTATRARMGLPGFISNFGKGRFGLTLLYFLRGVLNLGLVAFVLAAGDFSNGNFSLQVTGTLLGLAGLNLIGGGLLLHRWAGARATKLYQDAREWDARAPVVFLRAFTQDAIKLKVHALDPLARFPAGCGEARTLDELLLEHASIYGPVIAIGDPHNPTPPLGAARVFVEGAGEEWQEVVKSLLSASRLVVMCPSPTMGTSWEVNLVASRPDLRSIFLPNPNLPRGVIEELFAALAPPGQAPALRRGHAIVAAYHEPVHGWTVLTTRRRASVETYTVPLTRALQALLGYDAIALPKARAGSGGQVGTTVTA